MVGVGLETSASESSVTIKMLLFPLESDGNLLKGAKHF